MIMVILSGAGWIKEDVLGLHDLADCPAFVCQDVLGLHDLADCPAFVCRVASGFNDILCTSLITQQQGEDVRLQ